MNKLGLTLFLLLIPAIVFATAAEETITLTTPIVDNKTTSGKRVSSLSKDYKSGGPWKLIIQGCTSCTTGSPVWLEGTQTYFEIGVTNSLGANKTNVSGYAVTVGGSAAECNLSPAQFKTFVVNAVNVAAGDPIAKAAKDVMITCLGGT